MNAELPKAGIPSKVLFYVGNFFGYFEVRELQAEVYAAMLRYA